MESESDTSSEIEEEEVVDDQEIEDSVIESYEMMDIHALPIRAKPLFHNNHEEIEEFPLSESKDGLESTSIVVGDGLFRVVKTALHQDGVPRIDIQLAMDAELTSFQHVIEKPTPIEFGLTIGFAVLGVALMMVQGLTSMILGLSMFLAGLKFLPTSLEQHRLIFSSCGNSHEIKLRTLESRQHIPCFRASMALIGPAMADYMKLGVLDSTDINEFHSQLRAPVITQTFEKPQPQLPMPETPTEIIPVGEEIAPAGVVDELPDSVEEDTEQPVQELAQPVGPPVMAIPPPPEAIPAPLPPPLSPPGPPIVSTPPPPIQPPLAPMPTPPPGLNQPIPLDMPMPEAPRIAVQATPNNEPSISQEEQDALLEELS